MILKILLVIGVIGIVYFMFIKKKNITTTNVKKNKKAPRTNDMVECANCSVYSDIDESILSNAKYYCSKECIEEDS